MKPKRSISGTATLVKTAAEAIEMPVMAANTAFAITVATPSPPRMRRSMLLATSKMSLPRSAVATSRPIRTNSGTTPNSWLAIESLVACAINASATSILSRISQTPTKDSSSREMATCSPAMIRTTIMASETMPMPSAVMA